ncbi:MAG: glycosyltransferase family 4 protein [Spirochaetia bacterium]|nr:glycosyltransferase family 4 protein [Spirochaetia bacterium]
MFGKNTQKNKILKNIKVVMVGPANLGPYHYARFKEITKLLPNFVYIKINIKELYRPWQKDTKEEESSYNIIGLYKDKNISAVLKKEDPDILFAIGYNNSKIRRAALWAKRKKIPVVIQTDSTYDDQKRNFIKEAVKKILVKYLYDAAFTAGKRSADYIKSLGMSANMIWRGVDVIDNKHFSKKKSAKQNKKLPSKYFLSVVRLSKEKNIQGLVKAFEIYKENKGKWNLVIAGSGKDEKFLKNMVPKDLKNNILWYGWASYDELPLLYQKASCFVLPSTSEPWGLVVNEAMAAGLPVLISHKCGCVPELCVNNVNGYSFNANDTAELANLMFKISTDSNLLIKYKRNSLKIIKEYTTEKMANTMYHMVKILTVRQ